ncbi:MAG: TIGR02206 family membrane protein [Pyrinomonadaceae bacterium]|nr:TIGR02206 family membrane protein [Phycisphaerales bacterium]
MSDWMATFHPRTLQHAVCVAVCMVIMVGTSLLGLSLRARPAGDRLRIGIGVVGILYWIGSNIWWNLPKNFDVSESLPLQVCDLAGLIGPLALLTRKRQLRAILYFWGLVLSSQGFIQPILDVGAGHTRFWLFWANHTIIVGMAMYDLVALQFRPTWRDFFTAAGAILIYLILILPFDIVLDVNYGYVGNRSAAQKTIIDSLGPWPWRIAPLAAIALGAMAIMVLPWEFVRRREIPASDESKPADGNGQA